MWLPHWLYEGLPAVYIAGGSATLTLFGHAPSGRMSAIALFLATLLVAFWRRAARKPFEPDAVERPVQRWTWRAARSRA